MKSFDVDNQLTRVSILTYGNSARLLIKFSDYNNEADLLNAIKDISHQRTRFADINGALELTLNQALTERNGARNSVRKV